MTPVRFISSKNIVAKVVRDLKPPETTFKNDAKEWIAETLEWIKAPCYLETKRSPVTIKNYRAALPCNCYDIQTIDTGSLTKDNNLRRTEAIIPIDSDLAKSANSSGSNGAMAWDIVGQYIKFDIESGTRYVNYRAIACDEEGFPLVPDYIECREALSRGIIKNLLYTGFYHPVIKYEKAEQDYNEYLSIAIAFFRIPDMSQMDNIGRAWLRFGQDLNRFDNKFLPSSV